VNAQDVKRATPRHEVSAARMPRRATLEHLLARVSMNIRIPLVAALVLLVPATRAQDARTTHTPDGTLRATVDALQHHDLGALWELFPASYRDDVTRVVQQYARSVSPEVHAEGFALLAKLGALLRSQRELLLQTDLARGTGLDAPTLAARFDTLTELVDTLASCELARRDEFESLDVGAFLAGSGSRLARHVLTLLDTPGESRAQGPQEFLAAMAAAEFEVVDATTRRASVRVSDDHSGTLDDGSLVMVEVEGRWIPEDLAVVWNRSIARAETLLATPETDAHRDAALQMLSEAQVALDRAATATTLPELEALTHARSAVELSFLLVGLEAIVGRMHEAEVAGTKIRMRNLRGAIARYRRHHETLPAEIDELTVPSEQNFNESYVSALAELLDAWDNPLRYRRTSEDTYTLTSYGADGEPGGEGVDADITM